MIINGNDLWTLIFNFFKHVRKHILFSLNFIFIFVSKSGIEIIWMYGRKCLGFFRLTCFFSPSIMKGCRRLFFSFLFIT
jgi:hypothetical protein